MVVTVLGNDERFIMELEFVQSLANPAYLSFLSQRGYFEEPKFVAYLEYLQYLKRPPYIFFFTYPNGLMMLELLQKESFRLQLRDPDCIAYIHRQQFYEWLNSKSIPV